MHEITIQVTIRGGAGGVAVSIMGKMLTFDESGTDSIALYPGNYGAGVAGSAPPEGSVTITILNNAEKLAEEIFKRTTFIGIIPFTVSAAEDEGGEEEMKAVTPAIKVEV